MNSKFGSKNGVDKTLISILLVVKGGDMIRILYTVNGMRVNGVSSVIMQYIEWLPKNKYEFTIFTDEIATEYVDRLAKNNVKVIQSKNRKKNQLAYYRELISILKKGSYDLIHAHGNSATISVELVAAKQVGVPIRIAHSHNTTCTHKIFDRLLRPLFYSSYTHGIGCGDAAGKWLFGNRPHIVVKNGIDLEHFKYDAEARKDIRTQLGIDDCYVIGHIGRFTDQKNHEAILRIFDEYSKKSNAKLLLVGNGPKEAQIRELVDQMEMGDRVIFYGTVKDTAPLYSAMDVFLFPSKFEGVPLTLIEAQANGLHCVISDKISNEVNLTPLIQVYPLDEEKSWVRPLCVNNRLREHESIGAISELTKAGFDIRVVINQMDELYSNACRGNE